MTCAFAIHFPGLDIELTPKYSLSAWSKVPLEKLRDSQLVKKFPRVLWNNPKAHRLVHKSSPPVPVLRQIKQVHASHRTFRHSILMFSHLHVCIPSGIFPSGFPPKPSLQRSSPHTCYMPRLSRSWFDYPNDGLEYR